MKETNVHMQDLDIDHDAYVYDEKSFNTSKQLHVTQKDILDSQQIWSKTAYFTQELTPKERGLHYMNDVRRLDDEIYLLARYISEHNEQLVSLNSAMASLSNINSRESSEENELNDLIEIYSDKQKTIDELARILLEAQERRYAIVSGNHVNETRVACASKALLDPKKFDNQELWRLLHEKNIFEIDTVLNSAEEIGFNHISDIQYGLSDLCSNTSVFYPELSQFIRKLEMKCINSTIVIEQIIASCLDFKEQQILRFMYLTTHSSYDVDSGMNVSSIFNDDVSDDSLFNQAAYIGHLDNPFSEQFKCVLNDKFDLPLVDKFVNALSAQSDNSLNHELVTNDIHMQILGLFIHVVGIATIAVAFTVLNAATLGIPGVVVACVGTATTLGGFGLFKYAYDRTTTVDCHQIHIENSTQSGGSMLEP